MFGNATTAWDYFEGFVLVAHRPGPLVEADFDNYLEDMLPRDELKGAVVRASDGAPRPHQRERLQLWFGRNERHCAVLTSSLLARGGVTALHWFGVPVRAFAPGELDAALSFAGVPAELLSRARARLRQVIAAADELVAS